MANEFRVIAERNREDDNQTDLRGISLDNNGLAAVLFVNSKNNDILKICDDFNLRSINSTHEGTYLVKKNLNAERFKHDSIELFTLSLLIHKSLPEANMCLFLANLFKANLEKNIRDNESHEEIRIALENSFNVLDLSNYNLVLKEPIPIFLHGLKLINDQFGDQTFNNIQVNDLFSKVMSVNLANDEVLRRSDQ